MLRFNLFHKSNKKSPGDIINLIMKIKDGDEVLREQFITDSMPYVISTLSNLLGKYIDEDNSEEYSIGLVAFNEAIDNYDSTRNGNFYRFSDMVINHRIIDYIRKNKKYHQELPFSYLEESGELDERFLISDSHDHYDTIEVREELLSFEEYLNEFGISLRELALSSPRHKDSRILCIQIAKIITGNELIYEKFIKKKNIPLSDLLKQIKVNAKTVERNRKFIIAVSLILRSNLEDLKKFVKDFEGRGDRT